MAYIGNRVVAGVGSAVKVDLDAPTNALRVKNDGKIGIGKTDPTVELDVAGTVKATAFQGDGSSLTGIESLPAAIDVNGSAPDDSLAIDSAGNVGIGTASPSQKLMVSGTDARIYLTGANTDIDMDGSASGQLSLDGNAYAFGIALNSSGANLYTNSVSRDLIFGVNETEVMRVTNDSVGIGTSSPASLLHLSSGSPRITLTDTGTGADHRINADSGAGNLAFDVDYNSDTASPAVVFNIKGTERMRIDSAGDITTAGSITPGSYRPGEVIECLSGTCDGRTIVGLSGTYTWPDGTQHVPSTTYIDLNGSSLSYTPPAGTNHVKYEFNFQASYYGTSPPLYHLRFYYDGTEVTHGRMTQYMYYDDRKNYVIALSLNNGSESIAAGQIGTWDSAKIIKLMVRAYTTSFRPDINSTHYFDGVGSRQHVRPTLTITAIA